MGFPHVFHGEGLYRQLLVLMTVYPCFGHMSGSKEAGGVPSMTSYDYVPVERWQHLLVAHLVNALLSAVVPAGEADSHKVSLFPHTNLPRPAPLSTFIYKVAICSILKEYKGGNLVRYSLTGEEWYAAWRGELILHTSPCPCLHRESVSHVQTTSALWWAPMLTGSLWLLTF